MKSEQIYSMSSAKVYSCLVAKAERKGRTREEVDEIMCWLTGYTENQLTKRLEADVPYGSLFEEAPALNPDWILVTGSICGIRVEAIQEPTMRKIRCLDKMIDELAKGKPVHKILNRKKD